MSELTSDSIRKHFNNRQILNDIFLSCKPGEIVGLFGRNGSGKSTLLKIIFGSIKAEGKYVAIDNVKVDSLYEHREMIKYLPQDNFLPNHVSISQIISCFCAKENIEMLKKDPLVKPFLNKKIKQLSGGEKRILEILILIHSKATYFLLDEPFNGVAPLNVEIIKSLIKKHSKNKGFIITDHDYMNVLDISSRFVLIDDGNTRQIGGIDDLIEYGYLPTSSRKND
ncbi:ATP-binding cassette domain-containing protein [Pedobacter sp. BMA]|uniref:ATP-binding cassette domain-containing protein n=1 Tax=Pedobacter sp. BMA TaxID=1663685 RepID=UPI00069FD851|nr:ATP-binding cassette domain-containing protein [Pedobacter sp. BMA]